MPRAPNQPNDPVAAKKDTERHAFREWWLRLPAREKLDHVMDLPWGRLLERHWDVLERMLLPVPTRRTTVPHGPQGRSHNRLHRDEINTVKKEVAKLLGDLPESVIHNLFVEYKTRRPPDLSGVWELSFKEMPKEECEVRLWMKIQRSGLHPDTYLGRFGSSAEGTLWDKSGFGREIPKKRLSPLAIVAGLAGADVKGIVRAARRELRLEWLVCDGKQTEEAKSHLFQSRWQHEIKELADEPLRLDALESKFYSFIHIGLNLNYVDHRPEVEMGGGCYLFNQKRVLPRFHGLLG